jgi:hypothetical protein
MVAMTALQVSLLRAFHRAWASLSGPQPESSQRRSRGRGVYGDRINQPATWGYDYGIHIQIPILITIMIIMIIIIVMIIIIYIIYNMIYIYII